MEAAGRACDRKQELNVLDLDFTAEQDMLRATVRGVCATYCPLSVVRELEDDPVGYSTRVVEAARRARPHRPVAPRGVRRRFDERHRRGRAVRGARSRPRPHPPSGERRAERRGDRPQRLHRDQKAALAPCHRVGRGHLLGGVARARERLRTRRACRCGRRLGPAGGTLSGTKRHVAFASSATRIVVLARTGDADDAIDLFIVDPDRDGRHLDPADDHRVRRPVPRRLRRAWR